MKKLINIKWWVLLVMPLFFLNACKKGNDLYVSPNNPLEVTPALLLTAVQVSTFNSYEGLLVKYGSVLVQQNVGVDGQALPINNYTIAENELDNQWGQLYQALYNCKEMQTKFGEENPYYSGMADVMAAMNWGILTDLWGDIPFSEALQAQANYQPKYDAQRDVMIGILAMLDAGISKLSQTSDANTFLPGRDDLVYAGDVTKWIKLAYSLKARYQNRLSKTSLYNANDVLESLSRGIQNSNDDFVSMHASGAMDRNQWNDFQNNRQRYILAASTLVDAMQERPTDLRVYAYFDTILTQGQLVGSAIDVPSANASEWGAYLAGNVLEVVLDDDGNPTSVLRDPSKSVRLVSYVEMKFIEAEVRSRQGGDAATPLNEAIRESCVTVTDGVYSGADIAVYTGATATLEKIMTEKWMALFGSLEPYNDYRKTGFPTLTVNPSGRLNVIPKRFPTPQTERVGNRNAPVPALTEAVWWAQ